MAKPKRRNENFSRSEVRFRDLRFEMAQHWREWR